MNGACKIGPLKQLLAHQSCSDALGQDLKKAREVMETLEETARTMGDLQDGESIDIENYHRVFDRAYKALIQRFYGERAWEQQENSYYFMSYVTVHQQICSLRAACPGSV